MRHAGIELDKVTVTPTDSEGTQDSFSNISDVFDNLLLLKLPPKASGFDEAVCSVCVTRDMSTSGCPQLTVSAAGLSP